MDPRVDAVEVRWVDGRKVVLTEPGINKYHLVSPPR
jgi:hypothetical protein